LTRLSLSSVNRISTFDRLLFKTEGRYWEIKPLASFAPKKNVVVCTRSTVNPCYEMTHEYSTLWKL
jgi:hypothetical protein